MKEQLVLAKRRARFESWSFRGQYPAIYLPIARYKYRRAIAANARARGTATDPDSSPPPVTPSTDIVIEGYPRSGNTFAVETFRGVQVVRPMIAHHHHVPAQIIAGAKAKIPTVLLIRDPEDAALSYLVRYPHLTVEQALRHYVRFYSRSFPYRSDVLVVTFDEVTGDMGAVTRRINERFGTKFAEFEHTPENEARAHQDIQAHERDVLGATERFDAMTSRPSEGRDELKGSLRHALGSPRVAGLNERARSLYETFTRSSS
jgi:hypothetical protein